jgi:uncharacterized damage-inducible protein DinB
MEAKDVLRRYLQRAREALVWKVEGLGEYDVRRPLTPTATNLLGLLKHVASVEAGYLGECFGRPFPEALPWDEEGAERNADMWATPDESVQFLTGLYRRVWAHSDSTIDELDLDATGRVPWWGEFGREVTLHHVLVHVCTETERHAGHADIVRELIDGAVGVRREAPDLTGDDPEWWQQYRERVEQAARAAAGMS